MLANLRLMLERRSIILNAGLRMPSTSALQAETGILMAEEIFDVYRSFDGFAEHDDGSYLEMWGVNKISKINKEDFGHEIPNGYLAIGDILMGSEFIIVNLADSLWPVRFLYEEKIIGDTYRDFWSEFLNGHLDR